MSCRSAGGLVWGRSGLERGRECGWDRVFVGLSRLNHLLFLLPHCKVALIPWLAKGGTVEREMF
jgi:hypothetical protein